MPIRTPGRNPDLEPRVLQGGCHCGRVRFKVTLPPRGHVLEVIECNCSICRMTGFLHYIVPASRFELVQGEGALVDYRFNTRTAQHRFCATCGIKSFYVPRSHPNGIDINARCLDAFPALKFSVSLFDDENRDAATEAIAHLSQDGGAFSITLDHLRGSSARRAGSHRRPSRTFHTVPYLRGNTAHD